MTAFTSSGQEGTSPRHEVPATFSCTPPNSNSRSAHERVSRTSRDSREWQTLLAALAESAVPPARPHWTERWRRVLQWNYGARANAADALTDIASTSAASGIKGAQEQTELPARE